MVLELMASNVLWQYGAPRIGQFADRQRPEPVHNEISAWQHILNLIYKEALKRKIVDSLLSSPVETTENVQVQQSPVLLATPHQEGVGGTVRQANIVNRQAITFSEYIQVCQAESQVVVYHLLLVR